MSNVDLSKRKPSDVESEALMTAHQARMENENGLTGHPKANSVYKLACEFGHTNGYAAVEYYYNKFADLLKCENTAASLPSPERLGSAKPHKCPVCDGAGVVAYPPGTPAHQSFSSSSSSPWPCHACQGTGVIWG